MSYLEIIWVQIRLFMGPNKVQYFTIHVQIRSNINSELGPIIWSYFGIYSGDNTVLGINFTDVCGVISICNISQIFVSQRFMELFPGHLWR